MPSLTRMSCLEKDSAPCSALPLGSQRAASVKRCKAEASPPLNSSRMSATEQPASQAEQCRAAKRIGVAALRFTKMLVGKRKVMVNELASKLPAPAHAHVAHRSQ